MSLRRRYAWAVSTAAGKQDIDVEPSRVADLLERDPSAQLIDVREPAEHEAGHIAGTRHIALTVLSEQAATLDPARPVIFYCRVGGRSTMAAQALRAAGAEAYSMSGGMVRWTQEGRPLSPEGGYVADH